ncbi:MAG: hypothetical protein ACI4L9_01120 [Candidatus Coproplasma sp.]
MSGTPTYSFPEMIIGWVIAFFICFPLAILGLIIIYFMGLVIIPIELFKVGFNFDNFLVWLALVFIFIDFIGAFKFKFGKFQEDSTYISGSHYEATVESDDKVSIKEVNDYSGGGEWFLNIMLFILRMIIIALGGVIIFIVRVIKRHKYYKEY